MFKIWVLILCITMTDTKSTFTTVRAFNTREKAVLTWHGDRSTSLARGYTAEYQLYEITSWGGEIHEKLIPDPDVDSGTLDRYRDSFKEKREGR